MSAATTLVATFQPGFEPLAERDLFAAEPDARALATLAPGVWELAPAPDDPRGTRLAAALAGRPVASPIPALAFRHLHRVTLTAPVPTSLDALASSLAGLQADLGRGPYAVQTRLLAGAPWPGVRAIDINDAVAAALATRGPVPPYDRRSPREIVSLTLTRDRVRAGVSTATENLSPWPGGARRFAATDASPSRAEHKLEEALELFPELLAGLTGEPRALDLGAAPGGWTQVLANLDFEVTAIDPATLSPNVLADPRVRHLRITAEQHLERSNDRFDLVVNDVRMDARDVARLLVAHRRVLSPGGRILTTLKLPERRALPVLDTALAILGDAYRVVAGRQLFHNRNEVTLLLSPLGAAPRAASPAAR
ncbi:MAG: methyltransferase domain-containing protein [Deltaproteobacteria bacterium]|nr:methyltransferase domain-containing protein [Deltaproteobacteria bacterium]